MRVNFLNFILLILLTSASLICAQDKILFKYEGKTYTCEEVTGVSFPQGLKIAQDAKKIYETDPNVFGKNMTCRLRPCAGSWQDKDKSDMAGYYIHSLNGTVVYFASYQLFLELQKAFPIPDTENYPFIRDIEKYVNYPRKKRNFANEVKIFTEIKTYDEYVSYLKKKGETPFGLLNSQEGFNFVRKLLPYEYISQFAFPNRINQQPVSWYRWMLYTNLSEYYLLKALAENDTRKALSDEILFKYRTSSYILVRNATEADKIRIVTILKSLILEDEGKIAKEGLRKAVESKLLLVAYHCTSYPRSV